MSRLKELREQLGFDLREVASEADWSPEELREIERDPDELDEGDARTLGDLYGVDIDAWLESNDSDPHSPVGVLLRAQHDVLSAWARFTIAEATTVARDLRAAQKQAGKPTGWQAISSLSEDSDHRHPGSGNAERLAVRAREASALSEGPVPSMAKVFDVFGILVLWAKLPAHIDALSMATPELGGVMVGNLQGKHMSNAFLRRITFAHELCHILFDRPWVQAVPRFCCTGSRGQNSVSDDVERRARAFTTYFLAPSGEIQTFREGCSPIDLVNGVMETYGMGYEATRHHLGFVGRLPYDEKIPEVFTVVPPRWEAQDPIGVLDGKAVAVGVPGLRAGVVTDIVLQLYADKHLTASAASELLRVNPKSWNQLLDSRQGDRTQTWSTSSGIDGDWL
ncbi:MAG: ImmA/IrrE family metallo-endopeptidase [Deltaproteobacteria bacterium]|nr:ImmA/IrrE family metallo-endopeptidase [Deltaproteobacteria bacterium]